jgi:hypothetical protein
VAWLARLAAWLLRLVAAPAAARAEARAEGRAEAAVDTARTQADHAQIAARPRPDRDAALDRMRDGSL